MLTPDDYHPYQQQAYDWLRQRTEALVWLDLGMGKTVVAAHAFADVRARFPGLDRALVVSTRNIVEMTWPDELANWSQLRGLTYACATRATRRRVAAIESKPDILGINYENLSWLLALYSDTEYLPRVLILDEISKLKAHNTKRFRALENILHKFGRHWFGRRWGLTATPAAESYIGLWAQEASVSPRRRLGKNITAFRQVYCREQMTGGGGRSYSVDEDDQRKIENKLRPITLAMRARDHLPQQQPTVVNVRVGWSDAGVSAYEDMEDEFVAEVEHLVAQGKTVVQALNVGVQLNKLRQLCGGCLYDQGKPIAVDTTKLDVVCDMIESLEKEPVLVFYQYTWEQEQLLVRIPGAEVLKDARTLERWNAGDIPVLVLHPASAGHGLNLQGPCSTAIWYALPWSLEHYQQAVGRLQRQGQKQVVRLFHLLRFNSIDHDVLDRLQKKTHRQEDLFERVKARTKEKR